MSKTFSVDILSVNSIKQLKKDLLEYKTELRKKTNIFVKRLSEIGLPVIEQKISEAGFTTDENGIQSGSDTEHNSYVRLNSFGSYSRAILIVEGAELLFIEFGSGIKYNGAVGSSPNKKGQELGYTIGSYGKGNGSKETWGYINESGDLVLTHGTKATMPMYNATVEIINAYKKIAKEVFG